MQHKESQKRRMDKIRAKLHGIEGRYPQSYFNQIFEVLPKTIFDLRTGKDSRLMMEQTTPSI